jgi:uncharacterized membrane protein YgdD (TMEM256/DUF423 family)
MDTLFFVLGGLFGALGVTLGAFGAHALKARLPSDRLEIFETAVRYQTYHALALFATALALGRWPGSGFGNIAGWLFIAGILLFSGSLYLLISTGRRAWGAVTPLGGVAFIAGWLCLTLLAITAR